MRVQGKPNEPLGGYSTDRYTELAETFIRESPRDKPWFLWVCYGAVHGPTTPADRHKGKYQDEKVPVPADIFGPRPDAPTHFREIADWTPGPDGVPVLKKGSPLDKMVQQYQECTLAVDEAVGRFMSLLEKSGQLNNTVVVYAADQGFALGQHGLTAKQQPYHAKQLLAEALQMPMDSVTVNTVYQGCSFGGRGNPANHSENGINLLATLLSKATGQPIKLLYDRRDTFFGESGDIAVTDLKVGFKKDGTITAVSLKSLFAVYAAVTGIDHFVDNTRIPNLYCEAVPVDVSSGPAWWARCPAPWAAGPADPGCRRRRRRWAG